MSINELFDFDSFIIRTEFDARFSEDKVEEIEEERQKDIQKLLEKVREERFVEIENQHPSNLIKKIYKYARKPNELRLEFYGKFFESDNYYLMYLYYHTGECRDESNSPPFSLQHGEGIFNIGVLINRKNNERIIIGVLIDRKSNNSITIGHICDWNCFSVMTDSFNWHITIGDDNYLEKQITMSNMLINKEEINSPEELLDKMSNTFRYCMDFISLINEENYSSD